MATAVLSAVGVTVGMALFFTGIISLGVYIPIIAVSAGVLLVAILLFKKDCETASKPHSDAPPQVSSQEQEPPPLPDNSQGVETGPRFHKLSLSEALPINLFPVKDWNFSLPADPVCEERAQNIAKELLAHRDLKDAKASLCDCPYRGYVSMLQVFLALKKLDLGFACEVFDAIDATPGSEIRPICCLAGLLSEDEEVRSKAINNWVKINDHAACAQVYECVKSNPDLAQRMQKRMKDDEIFGLYLQVTAIAAEDPSAAAKLVVAVDEQISQKVLRCLPAPVAARIFMEMPFDEGKKNKLEFLKTCSLNLTNLLLCSMPPEEAANTLLLLDERNQIGHWDRDVPNGIGQFIRFMKLSPRATARILAHMPEKVILDIFSGNGIGCTCAIIDRIRPHLMEFNRELAERLFSPPYSPIDDRNISNAKLLAMDPQDVVSTLKGYTNNFHFYKHTLETMIWNSTLAQRKKIAQILVAFLNGGLLEYSECTKWFSESCDISSNEFSLFSNEWNLVEWLRTLGEDLPDDMLVRLIREMPAHQQEFLEILPEGRRKTIQNLIETIGKAKP